MYNHEKIKSLC